MGFQEKWLELAKKSAESDKYEAEILKSVLQIIDEKDYASLYAITKNYDFFVKKYMDMVEGTDKWSKSELPFWRYCLENPLNRMNKNDE